MNIRRLGGVAALVAALAFTGACGDSAKPAAGDTKPAAADAKPADAKPAAGKPAAELTAAMKKLQSDSYKYTLTTGPATGEGVADPAAKLATFKMSVAAGGATMTTETLVVDQDYYLKFSGMDLPGFGGGKWMHIDAAKAASGKLLGVRDVSDPSGVLAFANALGAVEKNGDRGYKGTLDFSKASNFAIAGKDAVGQFGDQMKALPFEATVDDKGRLASMSFTIPSAAGTPALPFKVAYSDFGAKVAATKPAPSEVTEAPETVYSMLG